MATNDKKADEAQPTAANTNDEPPMFAHIDDAMLKRMNTAIGRALGRNSQLTANQITSVRSAFDSHTSFLRCRSCGVVTQSAETPCVGCGAQYELTVFIGTSEG